MRKKKIYLDTSVISYLRQEDAPERMAETLEFWETLKAGNYAVVISNVTTAELARCPEPKRSEMIDFLSQIEYTEVNTETNKEVHELVAYVAEQGILPPKSVNDRLHIAAAIVSGCDILASWNFKHLVNAKTIDGVRMLSLANHLPTLDIYPPSMLLERSDDNG